MRPQETEVIYFETEKSQDYESEKRRHINSTLSQDESRFESKQLSRKYRKHGGFERLNNREFLFQMGYGVEEDQKKAMVHTPGSR